MYLCKHDVLTFTLIGALSILSFLFACIATLQGVSGVCYCWHITLEALPLTYLPLVGSLEQLCLVDWDRDFGGVVVTGCVWRCLKPVIFTYSLCSLQLGTSLTRS